MNATLSEDPLSDEADANVEAAELRLPVFTDSSYNAEWSTPLRMAALLALASKDWVQDWRGGMRIVTPWSAELAGRSDVAPDPEKHQRYQTHIVEAIFRNVQWLLPLLDVAQGTLTVSPGYCTYQVISSPGLHPIPPLLPFTDFLPWKTASDMVAH